VKKNNNPKVPNIILNNNLNREVYYWWCPIGYEFLKYAQHYFIIDQCGTHKSSKN